MANTGRLIVTSLRQRNVTTNTLTGLTKPNVPGDPDYIPPTTNLTSCPLPVTPVCPVVITTAGTTSISYSFSLAPADYIRALYSVLVEIKLGGTVIDDTEFVYPVTPNLFAGTFTGLVNGSTYTINVYLKDAIDGVLHTCTAVATVALSGGANCAIVTGLAVSNQTSSSAKFTWSAVSGVTGYQYNINGGAWVTIGNVLEITPTGLPSGAAGTFTIRAIDGGFTCPQTASIAFSTLGTGLFAVSNNTFDTTVTDISPVFFTIPPFPILPFTIANGTHTAHTGVIDVEIAGTAATLSLLVNGVLIQTVSATPGLTNEFSSVTLLSTDNVDIFVNS